MIRAFVAALALAIGVGGNTRSPATAPAPRKPPAAVFGVVSNATGLANPRLTRLKALTLEPVGRNVPLRVGGASATAFSPRGSMLAVGTADPGIELIDLRRMKQAGLAKVARSGWVTFLSWQQGTLFALVTGDRNAVAVVDPVGRRVIQRYRIGRQILGVEEETGGIVLLTAPRKGIGPVELTVVGGKGTASVSVSAISGGSATANNAGDFRTRQVVPGLAVDDEGERALIVSANNTVAEVSLNNLAIAYHTLSQPASLLGRLRNWLEPAAEGKLLEGPQRKAVWLGDGLVAVTGADYATVTDENGDPEVNVEAVGLFFLDTSSWSLRKIDDETSDVARVGETLLAFGDTSWGEGSKAAKGLVGYDLRGQQLFHLFGDTRVSWVETVGGLVYVPLNRERRAVVDAATGRVYGRTKRAKPLSLVAA